MSTKTAIAYVRISSDPDEARAGVERQREDVQRLAAELGAELRTVYEDNDVSAWKKRKAATEWGRALAAIERDRPDYLLVYKTDRLGRRLSDLEGLEELCRSTGTKVVSKAEGEVFKNPAWPILAAVAKMESANTSTRVKRAQETRRAKGLSVNGGIRPFGYKADRVTVIPREADVIREMYWDVLHGASVHACVRALNQREVPTVRGGQWNINRVGSMLRNPRYAGLLTRKGVIIGKGSWEPIVQEETWAKVQEAIKGNDKDQGPRRTTLLGGLVRCGACGSRMDSNGAGAYRCSRGEPGCVSRAMPLLDDYVTKFMLTRFSEDLVRADKTQAKAQVRLLRRQAWHLSGQVQDATAAWQEGRVPETRAFLDALAGLRRREDRLKKELAQAQLALEVASVDTQAAKHWEAWTQVQRRRWLAQRIDVITVRPAGRGARTLDPDTVTITLVER